MRMVRPAHASTKFFPHLLPGFGAHWICAVNFHPLAPPTSPHSTSRLYIVMTSQFYISILSADLRFFKSKSSTDQKFVIDLAINNFVCSSSCPVNGFTDVASLMAVYRENAFWATREFFAALLWLATGLDWKQSWTASSFLGQNQC